jgi:hypothetical protein
MSQPGMRGWIVTAAACAALALAAVPAAAAEAVAPGVDSPQPAVPAAPPASPSVPAPLPPLKEVAKALRAIELDSTRSVPVSNLQVGSDVMDITLLSGRIFFAKPWRAGEIPSHAIFEGEGRARLTPVNPLERHEFSKGYAGRTSLDETFQHAYLRFSEDFFTGLAPAIKPDSAPRELVDLFADRLKAQGDLPLDFDEPLVQSIVERAADPNSPRAPGPRLVEFRTAKNEWLAFAHDPNGVEENALYRHQKMAPMDLAFGRPPILSIWNDREDYEAGGDLEKEEKDRFVIVHVDGDFTVQRQGLLLDAVVGVDVKGRYPSLATVTFDLIRYADFISKQKEFIVRSVTTADGAPLEYMHTDQAHLLVRLDKPLRRNEVRRIVVSYTADFIRPNPSLSNFLPPGASVGAELDALDAESKTFTLLNTFPWYPQSGYIKRHTLDWRIKVPKPLLAISSGTTEKRWEEGDYNCMHTVAREPVGFASWLFGNYEMYTDPADTARPKIYVYGLIKQKKQLEPLYHQARNVIAWYEQKFTPFPYDELDIAQMGFFYGFGQAPPGLVQLTGEAFLSQGELAALGANTTFIYAFVAHEIGHEWFGHVVSWVSYHDQWLSESYTEYMSGLYVADLLGPQAFEQKKREWRTKAMDVSDGGSIWLGGRSAKDYTSVTYSKGPYVLHMLRLSMQAQFGALDGDKMFMASLKEFLARYRHQNATTNELVASINQTTGKDFTGFFDQWFRGYGIPDLKVSYTLRPTEDGKILASVTVNQTDPEAPKQLMLPISFEFGGNTVTRFMPVTGAESTWQLKLPSKPDRVVVNPGDGLLAKVKVESR